MRRMPSSRGSHEIKNGRCHANKFMLDPIESRVDNVATTLLIRSKHDPSQAEPSFWYSILNRGMLR